MSFGPPETGAEPLRGVRRALKAMSTPSRARISLRFMGPQDRLLGAIQLLITLVFLCTSHGETPPCDPFGA